MEKDSRGPLDASSEFLSAGWFDPIEAVIRGRIRGFIEDLVEAELDATLGRSRYERPRPADGVGGTALGWWLGPSGGRQGAVAEVVEIWGGVISG